MGQTIDRPVSKREHQADSYGLDPGGGTTFADTDRIVFLSIQLAAEGMSSSELASIINDWDVVLRSLAYLEDVPIPSYAVRITVTPGSYEIEIAIDLAKELWPYVSPYLETLGNYLLDTLQDLPKSLIHETIFVPAGALIRKILGRKKKEEIVSLTPGERARLEVDITNLITRFDDGELTLTAMIDQISKKYGSSSDQAKAAIAVILSMMDAREKALQTGGGQISVPVVGDGAVHYLA